MTKFQVKRDDAGKGELARMLFEIPDSHGRSLLSLGAIILMTSAVALALNIGRLLSQGKSEAVYVGFGVAIFGAALLVVGFVTHERTKRGWEMIKRYCEGIDAERVLAAGIETQYLPSYSELVRRLWKDEGRREFSVVWLAGAAPYVDRRSFWEKAQKIRGIEELAEVAYVIDKREMWGALSIVLPMPFVLVGLELRKAFLSHLPKVLGIVIVVFSILTLSVLLGRLIRLWVNRTMPEDREIRGFFSRMNDDEVSLFLGNWRLGRIAKEVLASRRVSVET